METNLHEGFVGSDVITYNISALSQLDSADSLPTPIVVRAKDTGNSAIALWGDGNDFPQLVIEDIRKDPEIGGLIKQRAALLRNFNLVWGTFDGFDDNGEILLKPLEPTLSLKIFTFLQKTNWNQYKKDFSVDWETFSNVFVNFSYNLGRTEIAQLCVQAAEQCRFGKQNNKGVIEKCYISKEWPGAKPENKELVAQVPVLDPYYNPAGQMIDGKDLNYIYPVNEPSPGNNYYQIPAWNSIREAGWVKYSALLAKYRSNVLVNLMGIKHQILIYQKYFDMTYKNWENIGIAEREQIKKDTRTKLDKFCTGEESTGKTILINFIVENGTEIPLVKFVPVESGIKKGEYMEEGKMVNFMKNIAFDVHPALSGITPDSGLGGGGSNIREAADLHYMKIHSDILAMIQPLNVIRDVNGWGEDVVFMPKQRMMTTLDKSATGLTDNTKTKPAKPTDNGNN